MMVPAISPRNSQQTHQKPPLKPALAPTLPPASLSASAASDTVRLRIKATPDSDVSEGFLQKVMDGMASMPAMVITALNSGGWNVQVSKFLTDALPHMKGVTPRGSDRGTTAEHRSGVTLRPTIYLSEYQWCPPPKKESKFVHSRLFPSLRRVMPPVESPFGILHQKVTADRTLRHEAGHALDQVLNRLSDSPAFMRAYERDLAMLSPEGKQEVYYFIQPDAKGQPTLGGRHEALAEAFATLWGGGCNEAEHFQTMFPGVMQFAREQVEQLEKRKGRPPSVWDKGPPKI